MTAILVSLGSGAFVILEGVLILWLALREASRTNP
jgi:hypothetical protein